MIEPVFREDIENHFAWHTIETYFDDLGRMTERRTEYDDGTRRDDYFEDGIRTVTYQIDGDPSYGDLGVKSWSSIKTYYDEAGKIAERRTENDDGTRRDDYFENGIRTVTYQIDGDPFYGDLGFKTWSNIETYYDEAGKIAERRTDYDNGIQKDEYFEGGIRSVTFQTDGSEGGGAKAWQSIATFYDEEGRLSERSTEYDNGGARLDLFEDGIRFSSARLDASFENPDSEQRGDAAWDGIYTIYDETGATLMQAVEYDNTDVLGSLYEHGELVARIAIDNDDSHSWFARETLIDTDTGARSYATYDTVEELPEEYEIFLNNEAVAYAF